MTAKKKSFKLPKYLRLARGSMWFDEDGDNASGVRLYAVDKVFVGRGQGEREDSVPKDKYSNQNFIDYGWVDDKELPWYVDTTQIPPEKQSRLITAYNNKILVEADPKNPPQPVDEAARAKNFKYNKDGDMVFVGKNKAMFQRLQRSNFDQLRTWINASPVNSKSKNDLIDMYHYEQRGYNSIDRPRGEVLDLIRDKLKEFGPTMSAIRVNEDD